MRLTTTATTITTGLAHLSPVTGRGFDVSEVMPTITLPPHLARLIHLAVEDAERKADEDMEMFRSIASSLRSGNKVALFADGEAGAVAADRLADDAEERLNQLVELMDLMQDEDRFALIFK